MRPALDVDEARRRAVRPLIGFGRVVGLSTATHCEGEVEEPCSASRILSPKDCITMHETRILGVMRSEARQSFTFNFSTCLLHALLASRRTPLVAVYCALTTPVSSQRVRAVPFCAAKATSRRSRKPRGFAGI